MRNIPRFSKVLITGIYIGFLLSGCATVPRQFEREASASFEHTQTTSLGKLCEGFASGHEGMSGFSLLNEGRSAFLARTAMADLAERSLDVQYYIWEPDKTGNILLMRLIKASRRGVRVRLLIDELNAGGYEFGLRALDACPNIEVRIYNPFGKHVFPKLGRSVEFVAHFRRLNHRMHNKLFIADNQIAIIGGRNIADSYFGVDSGYNFRDFDLFSVGPVVKDISKSFDEYWNSNWAVPIRALYPSRLSAHEVEKAYLKLENQIAAHPEYPYKIPISPSESFESVSDLCRELIWAQARAVYDSPGKSTGPGSHLITAMLKQFLESAKKEILIVTPYLVPSVPDVLNKRLEDFRSRGVAVSILTNSLGSTDLTIAHAGYAKCREILVDGGVKLYEMRPDAASRAIYTAEAGSASVMGLHGKAALVDRALVFIGTFNFDQRSAWINTEVGVLIYSPELGQRIASAIAVDLQGENSWRVAVASDCRQNFQQREATKGLVWIAEEDGRKTCLAGEPSAGIKRRLFRSFISLLPIESQL